MSTSPDWCNSPHPDQPLTCRAPARNPNHDLHFSVIEGTGEVVHWENPDFVPLPPASSRERTAQVQQDMLGLARRVDEGRRLGAEGMAQAIEHSPDDWRERFDQTLRRLASSGRSFTSEDVSAEVGLPTGAISQHRNNAVGALINAAARQGIIRKTGRHVVSQRPSSHGRELTEWIGTSISSDGSGR